MKRVKKHDSETKGKVLEGICKLSLERNKNEIQVVDPKTEVEQIL